MEYLISKGQCTGCMACLQACPKQCIKTKKDNLGHIYPMLQNEQCINCNICKKVCPVLTKSNFDFQAIKKAYAVWSLNSKERKSSASGGVASEFYRYALKQNYYICGVQYQDNYYAEHRLSKDLKDISKYKQSKYVFSDSSNIYKRIKSLLDNDEKVLFISLPCKVAGLMGYLGKQYKNLITVDIVCHGTPSYQNLQEHIKTVTNGKYTDKLQFRMDNEFLFSMNLGNKNIYSKIGRQDMYLAAFLEGINYRESCYQCSYAIDKRISDITICDFWGLGQEIPFEHPYSGAVSAVLINNEVGQKFFNDCCENFFVEERTVEEAVKGNAQLNYPTPEHKKRKQFEELYEQRGFEKAVYHCLKSEIKEDKKELSKRLVRHNLRRLAGIFIKRYRG